MKVILAISTVISVIWLSCNKKVDQQWEQVKIDPDIANDTVYHRLDKFREIYFGEVPQDSSARRSSDVTYSVGIPDEINTNKYSKSNNCRAFYYNSDTLRIRIGSESEFSGRGFAISYKAKKFFVEPFDYVDHILEGAPKSSYKVDYQNVTLNKVSYSVGDSIYGSVDFKSIETMPDDVKRQHTGKGLFRTKIVGY